MADPFLSEIRLVPYGFAPKGWAICAGQLMAISQNQALFSLLGTYYGGNGTTNFALPNLQDRAVLGVGHGPGLSNYDMGNQVGSNGVSLTPPEVMYHSHDLLVSSAAGTQVSPVGNYPAVSPSGMGFVDGSVPVGAMPPNAVSPAGSVAPQAHENRQPYIALNYIIALVGIFPSRN